MLKLGTCPYNLWRTKQTPREPQKPFQRKGHSGPWRSWAGIRPNLIMSGPTIQRGPSPTRTASDAELTTTKAPIGNQYRNTRTVASKAPKGEPWCDTDQGTWATEAKTATVTIEATKAREAKEATEVSCKSDRGESAQRKLEETGKVARSGESDQQDIVK